MKSLQLHAAVAQGEVKFATALPVRWELCALLSSKSYQLEAALCCYHLGVGEAGSGQHPRFLSLGRVYWAASRRYAILVARVPQSQLRLLNGELRVGDDTPSEKHPPRRDVAQSDAGSLGAHLRLYRSVAACPTQTR